MRLLIVGSLKGQLTTATKIAMDNGASVTHAEGNEQAMAVLRGGKGADLLLVDVGLDIRDLVMRLEAEHIHVPIVACGITNDARAAVAAIHAGAKEYIPLPPDPELIAAVLAAVANDSRDLVYRDDATAKVIKLAQQIAGSDASVMITGESGTGKEVLARYVHSRSARAKRPFISINCAAIPEHLLESELFGHEKGAFTGAIARRIGKFEEATGGTLLLDEISEMDVRLQSKLLRAIQERVIDRVGGTRPVPVDIRIIATSNRNLSDAVREGTFREDLLFRLNVVNLKIPPLRERPADVIRRAGARGRASPRGGQEVAELGLEAPVRDIRRPEDPGHGQGGLVRQRRQRRPPPRGRGPAAAKGASARGERRARQVHYQPLPVRPVPRRAARHHAHGELQLAPVALRAVPGGAHPARRRAQEPAQQVRLVREHVVQHAAAQVVVTQEAAGPPARGGEAKLEVHGGARVERGETGLEPAVGLAEPAGEADLEPAARRASRVGHRGALGPVERHGLLDQDVEPRPERGAGEFRVAGGGSEQEQRIGAGAQQLGEVGLDRDVGQPLAGPGAPLFAGVADGDQLRVRRREQGRQVEALEDPSQSRHRDPDGRLRHGLRRQRPRLHLHRDLGNERVHRHDFLLLPRPAHPDGEASLSASRWPTTAMYGTFAISPSRIR